MSSSPGQFLTLQEGKAVKQVNLFYNPGSYVGLESADLSVDLGIHTNATVKWSKAVLGSTNANNISLSWPPTEQDITVTANNGIGETEVTAEVNISGRVSRPSVKVLSIKMADPPTYSTTLAFTFAGPLPKNYPNSVPGRVALPTGTSYMSIGSYNGYELIQVSYFGEGPRYVFVGNGIYTIHTMNYQIFTNSTTLLSEARSIMDDIEQSFRNNFGINLVRQGSGTSTTILNPRPGCLSPYYCTASCGVAIDGSDCWTHHHKSASHFLLANPGNITIKAFNFVDFGLCHFRPAGHGAVSGLCGSSMIASTYLSPNARSTTAHEISHMFGTQDDSSCTPGELCVMSADVFDQWCTRCRAIIMSAIA